MHGPKSKPNFYIFNVNSLSGNPTKWSNTQTNCWLLQTNYLSVFDHYVGLVLKWLRYEMQGNAKKL